MIDKRAIAILVLVVSLPIISTIAAIGTNLALALNFNKNEKITQLNLCRNKAFCKNRFLQAPGNSFGLEQQSIWGSQSSEESPSLTPSLGKITMSGIAMSDISSIDPSGVGSVIATIRVGSAPTGVAFDSINGNLYVANHADNTISVISGQNNAVLGNPIAVGSGPVIFGLAFDSSNDNLYVSNFGTINSGGGDSVSVVSGQTNTVIDSPIAVGRSPEGIAFDPANGNLYVANRDSNTVSVISGQTNTVIGDPITVGPGPVGIAFDADSGNLYVTNAFGTTVSVISGQNNTVIGDQIAVGTNPRGIAFDSANGNLYVANCVSGTVSVISGKTNTAIDTIPVGQCPAGIAFDANNGNLYVNNELGNTVSVISGQTNAVIGSIPVGTEPYWIAFDSDNCNVYVTNINDNTVSVIATTHSPTLTLNPISSVPWGKTVTVTGKLTDSCASNAGIAGKTITFSGTGAANLASVITNPDGTFNATGTAPNTVATGWTVQAHFAGDSSYEASNSSVQTYSTFSTTPPNTTITSVTDGNGATVKDGATTLSTSIHITFTGQAGTNPIAGFECSLDNSAFSSCSSPTTLTNLAVGNHTFQVSAIDTLGNKDPTPAQLSWAILTPTQGIDQLIHLIKSMNLNHGLQTSLIASLNAALDSLTHNNHVSACNQLIAFINKVHAAVSSGRLSTANALQLTKSAQAIQNALGCK